MRWVAVVAVLATAGVRFVRAADQVFDYNLLKARAKTLAEKPYVKPTGEAPEWLKKLTYDDLRMIHFAGPESLWQKERLPFQAQFLHPGFLFDKFVHLNEVRGGMAKPLPFEARYFRYNSVKTGEVPDNMGFAGFRLMYPFGGAGTDPNEIGAFAGASYFRFLSENASYGLSARGLALDTAEPTPEEFPIFSEFWLEKPDPTARAVTVYALLESESVTGAYRFVIAPGKVTAMDVTATLYCRKNPKVFGVAPLTSMFWHGENSDAARDFRPEVHDSDGLLMLTGADEWIWRPLSNVRGVRVSAFADENPRAFGLLQRDRNFENYQDLEASYHSRPSAWIEPKGRWGKGSVRLVELPTTTEFDDNIVAFWVPDSLPAPGQPITYEYRLSWFLDTIGPPAGFVRGTRHGKSARFEPGMERFVIDFDGQKLRAIKANLEPDDPKRKTTKQLEPDVEHVLTVGGGGKLNHSSLQKNPINNTWRVAFTVRPDGSGKPVELRCFLKRGQDTLTETWSYLWQP